MINMLRLLIIQNNIAMRNKQIIMVYYVLPILFFIVFGFVLVNMDKSAADTLPLSMTVFASTMGTLLGLSTSIHELLKKDQLKAFKIMNIRVWKILLAEQASCSIHLIMQNIIIICLSALIFDSPFILSSGYGYQILGLFLYLLFMVLLSSVLAMLIHNRNVLLVFSLLFFFMTILFGGVMFPTSFLPEIFQKAANMMPSMKVLSIAGANSTDEILFLASAAAISLMIYIISFQFTVNRKAE